MIIKLPISFYLLAPVLISSFTKCSELYTISLSSNTINSDNIYSIIDGRNQNLQNEVEPDLLNGQCASDTETIEESVIALERVFILSRSLYASKYSHESKIKIISFIFGFFLNNPKTEEINAETKKKVSNLLFYPTIFHTLTHCADILSANEAAVIARAFPAFFSVHYDFLANIQDFSAFNRSDIRTCFNPAKHFSLLSFPAAVKTLSMRSLTEVLIQIDFELDHDGFRAVVSARGGASEFINSPDFSQNPFFRSLMKMFELHEFETAAADKYENDLQIIKSNSDCFHDHLGNLLSSERIVSILQDVTITDKQAKVAVLSYLLTVERQIGLTFMRLSAIYNEIAVVDLKFGVRVESFLKKSESYRNLLRIIFAERRNLLSSLCVYRPQLANIELFHIPFDLLIRDSLSRAPTDSIALMFTHVDSLSIWLNIWKSLNLKYDELPYNIDLVRDKYSHSNHLNIIKEWEETTKDTLHFKSGPTSQSFLAIVTANMSTDLQYNVQKEFYSKNPRSFPLLFQAYYNNLYRITDFSCFGAEEIANLMDPFKSFSIFSLPVALKTVSFENLLIALDQLDFDLDVFEFRYLVSIRGAAELINSPEFSHHPLIFPLLKMFTSDEFEAAAVERTIVSNQIQISTMDPRSNNLDTNSAIETPNFDNTPPWIHKYLGNLLNCDFLLLLNGNLSVPKWNVKIAVLSYVVSTEGYISRIFVDLKKIFFEAKKEPVIDRESGLAMFRKSAQPHYESLLYVFDERKKLFDALFGRPHRIYHLELLKIPFNILVREALIHSMEDSYSSFDSFTDNNRDEDDLTIYSIIWKHFEYKEHLPYDYDLIRYKFSGTKQYNVIKLWCEETRGNAHFQSGFTARKFLSVVMSKVNNLDNKKFLNVLRECVHVYSVGNPDLGVLFQKYSENSLFDQEVADLKVLENLASVLLAEILKIKNGSRKEKDLKNTYPYHLSELVLANKIRSFSSEYFVQLLGTSTANMNSKLSEVISNTGSILPDEVIESLLRCTTGRTFLQDHPKFLHSLANYSMFTSDDFLELNVDISKLKLSIALHTIPFVDSHLKDFDDDPNGIL